MRAILIIAMVLVVSSSAVVHAQTSDVPCEAFAVYPIIAMAGEPLLIEWEACAGATEYGVVVVDDDSNILVLQSVSEPSLTADLPLTTGAWLYGAVTAKDANGDKITETIFDPFKVLPAGSVPGVVRGTITWNGQPVPNIPVLLGLACYNQSIQTALTDENGNYEFARVAPDAYTVRVNYGSRNVDASSEYTQICPDEQLELLPGATLTMNASIARRDLAVERPEEPTDQAVTITWAAYPDAASYTVIPNHHPELEQTTSDTTITLAGMMPWEFHNVTVKAYNAAGEFISEGYSGRFEVVIPGQARPTPTPVPPPAFSQLAITTTADDVRATVLQAQPGDVFDVWLAEPVCCYFLERVEIYDPVWTVTPAELATLEQGTLTIAEDAPNGTEITITASYAGETLTETVYVYRPDENPLVGNWYETAQLTCGDGSEMQTGGTTIGELLFLADGRYYVTWGPFEVYFDYRGDYQYSLATGSLTLTASAINYLPADFAGTGTFELQDNGDLIITGIDFGTPPYGTYAAGCGYRFAQR